MPKIALVHDYLQEFGGAERVILALHQAFPDAPLYTGFFDPSGLGEHASDFADISIHTTWLQKLPAHTSLRSPLRLLAPKAFASLDLLAYDVVIVSTNAYHAKAVRVRPDSALIVYCHTPARSLYGYDTRSDWRAHTLTRLGGQLINHFLRLRDFDDAQRADRILVNSHTVAARVAKFWRRDSQVVYPPVFLVDQAEKDPSVYYNTQRDGYLFVNRLNVAKHPELAVQAAIQLGCRLQVVGDGPLLPALRQQIDSAGASDRIHLLGHVGDDQLPQLYAQAEGLLYPVVDEDFGIVPIEALAYGCPVIAHHSGGPAETITDGQTGVFFADLTLASLQAAITRSQQISWDPAALHAASRPYSQAQFMATISQIVNEYVKKS